MDDYPFDLPSQPGTPVDWYLERMKLSGITQKVAETCKFKFGVDDTGAFFRIPYFTVDGEPTTHYRLRRRDPVVVHEKDVSTGGQHKGKYWQPNKKQRFLYWPPIYNQRVLYNDPSVPLLICEGELKSVAAQMAIAANGVPVLVCGMPGTELSKMLADQLREINCVGSVNGDAVHRIVYVAFDWNARGQARERTEEAIYQMTKLFEALGAKVVALRWELTDGMKGEQKLDDWLVAGGDIGKAMQDSLDDYIRLDTEVGKVQKDLLSRYVRLDNNYIPLRDITKCYSPTEFNGIEANFTVKPTKRKQDHMTPHFMICDLLPEAERNTVYGRAFVPSPLGIPTDRIVYQNDVRLLNVAPPAIVIPDLPFSISLDPWYELIGRLCPEPGTVDWFLNFLAHCAQRPMERGHHIILFQDDGGTGKSTLFQTLDQVFGPLCGPIGDALTSKFNAPIEGKIIGHASEILVEGKHDRFAKARIKSITGDDKFPIEHKGVNVYFILNYIRLLLATNMDYVVPIEPGERRWAVFGGESPWEVDRVESFVHWRAHGGVAAIQTHLVERDISKFNIFAPCPVTEHRRRIEEISAPLLVQWMQEGLFLVKDIWTNTEIQMLIERTLQLKGAKILPPTTTALGLLLKRAGFEKRPVKCNGKAEGLWAIRNTEKWRLSESPAWAEEHAKVPPPNEPKY